MIDSNDKATEYPAEQCYNGVRGLKKAGIKVELSYDQLQEMFKCSQDPEYFIENYCQILHVDKGIIPFIPFGYQKKMVKMIVENRFTLFKLFRQAGKTTIVSAVLLWYAIFTPAFRIAVLANKADQSQEILTRIKMMYEFLPWWMQPGVTRWNEMSVGFGNRSSIIGASTKGTSVRGRSLSMVYLDEFAWIDNDVEFYTSTYPTITSGQDTKIIITSTPHGMNLFYKLWIDAVNKRNSYAHYHVHWSEYPGRDEEWKQEQIKNTSERQFSQEFELEFLGSSDTLLSPNTLQRLTFEEPVQLLGDNKEFRIYRTPEDDHSYVMTVDVSEGIGLDYSVISVIDATVMPYQQVAMLRTNTMIPTVFSELAFRIGNLYNEAVAVIETNSIGQQVADDLWNLEYENVLKTVDTGVRGAMVKESGRSSKVGVRTTTKTKALGCANLKALCESNQLIIKDFDTVQELSNFVKKGNSFEADAGQTDDICMTLVIFSWFALQNYFSDWTNISSRSTIRDNIFKQEEYEPFMFMDDGTEDSNWLLNR